jgi:hypothetical protein
LTVEMLGRFGVSTDPQRVEKVTVEVCDGDTSEIWWATIHRRADQPPTLGEWEKQDFDVMQGRLADILRGAFTALRR